MTEPSKLPTIVICATGLEHTIYCVWAVRSLRQVGYADIEIFTNSETDRAFLRRYLGDITVHLLEVDMGGHKAWTYRQFAMLKHTFRPDQKEIVICDTDVLWKKNPSNLFRRVHGKTWFQKITAVDPGDFDKDNSEISPDRWGTHTVINYRKRFGLPAYVNHQVNGGLFLIDTGLYKTVLTKWVAMIRALPPKEVLMTECLFSVVLGELGVEPGCDRADIKHLTTYRETPVPATVAKFQVIETPPGSETGYQVATHYLTGGFKAAFYRDAQALGVDPENLAAIARREVLIKKFKRFYSRARAALSLSP